MTAIEQLTSKFNKLRDGHQGKELSSSELRRILSDAKIPYASRITVMVELGIFISPMRGIYMFPNIPIYIRTVEHFYENIRNNTSEYNKNYAAKSIQEKIQKMTIKEAIQVLKTSGEYTIYKKIVQWEEVK